MPQSSNEQTNGFD